MAKTFSWTPVRALMKESGAEVVSKDAVDALITILEKKAKELTTKALEMTRHSGRKKLSADDLKLALALE